MRNPSPAAAVAAALLAMAAGVAEAQSPETTAPPEPLAPPEALSADRAGESAKPVPCPMLVDKPIGQLNIDITPRDEKGVYVHPYERPQNCWNESGRATGAVFVHGGCGGCWNCHDLLQLARFRHHPLYFEDAPLERYGAHAYAPGVRSTTKFLCDLALLPLHLLQQRPKSCVLTPTPHCCTP
ncbi:MAG: hypothetical protein AAGJ46_03400 [Planctomycetota bacterium]